MREFGLVGCVVREFGLVGCVVREDETRYLINFKFERAPVEGSPASIFEGGRGAFST